MENPPFISANFQPINRICQPKKPPFVRWFSGQQQVIYRKVIHHQKMGKHVEFLYFSIWGFHGISLCQWYSEQKTHDFSHKWELIPYQNASFKHHEIFPIYLFIFIYLFIHLLICLITFAFTFLFIFMLIFIFSCVPTFIFTLFIYLFICLLIHLFMSLFIY